MQINRLTVITALLAATLAAGAHAEAKSAKKKSAKPKFVNSSSQESTSERDRRLYRECKGRPNAGACSGYAS